MVRLVLAVAALVALAGCASDGSRCQGMGYAPGTALFLNCLNVQAADRQARSAALARLAQQYQPRPIPVPAPMANGTTCRPIPGGGFNCSPY